jgi:predicted lipoprotein with Yx(FWY)xxD motif
MRPTTRLISLAGLATAALLFVAACSAAATPSATVLAATATPAMATPTMAASAMATTPAAVVPTIGVTTDATLGAYLTGAGGMTLYIFKNDTPDTSTCTGTCATNWPALTAPAGSTITPPTGATGTFSLITRPDGTMQVAYDHQPLYYYAGDSKAGDTTGQGLLGKWFVAPAASASATSTAAAPTAKPRATGTFSSTY